MAKIKAPQRRTGNRKPSRWTERDHRKARFLNASVLPPIPPTCDYSGQLSVPEMDGNDTLGDCTCASIAHLVEVVSSLNGNLGGKCADLNGLFVGLCRSLGIPARDVYGLRVAPSAFGYKELGGNSANLKGAQHCRSEVYLKGHGWVGMDPADVAKVMRQETAEWIKTPDNAVVAPVKKAIFGGWEGNWMAFNSASDVKLPGAQGPQLGFLMYPIGENAAGRLNSYAPDDFKYQISAREIKA